MSSTNCCSLWYQSFVFTVCGYVLLWFYKCFGMSEVRCRTISLSVWVSETQCRLVSRDRTGLQWSNDFNTFHNRKLLLEVWTSALLRLVTFGYISITFDILGIWCGNLVWNETCLHPIRFMQLIWNNYNNNLVAIWDINQVNRTSKIFQSSHIYSYIYILF